MFPYCQHGLPLRAEKVKLDLRTCKVIINSLDYMCVTGECMSMLLRLLASGPHWGEGVSMLISVDIFATQYLDVFYTTSTLLFLHFLDKSFAFLFLFFFF